MADTDSMIRLQIRLYREEDPKLFDELSAISSRIKRARRTKQLLRDALLAEEGIVPKKAHEVASTSNQTSEPVSPIVIGSSAKKAISDSFEQSNFATKLSIKPGLHFAPRMRVANES